MSSRYTGVFSITELAQLSWTTVLEKLQVSYKVRKTGVLVVLCPFHREKTPSLHVWPGSGRYHCFGCGVEGVKKKFITNLLEERVRSALPGRDEDLEPKLTPEERARPDPDIPF